MYDKGILEKWIIDALHSLGGSGSIVQVCKHVWDNHEGDLRKSGDLFYTWGYDIRWARNSLADKGKLDREAPKGIWRFAR